MKTLVCLTCGAAFTRRAAQQRCQRQFCSRPCSHAARRTAKAEKVERKRAYDAARREALRDKILADKRAYYERTKDLAAAAAFREANRETLRARARQRNARPDVRAEKRAYDRERTDMTYGDFADAARLLLELKREIVRQCPDKYERAKARGFYERNAQQRRRNDGQA